MPTYVWRNGVLIDRNELPVNRPAAASDLPAPAVQSFETYASPITDAPISSPRQRDRDLHTSGSYDPRDTPVAFRRAQDARRKSKRSPAVP